MCIDFIFWDMPFGLGLAEWDVLLTDDELQTFFLQLSVINKSDKTVIALVVHWTDAPRVKSFMEKGGFTGVHPVYVYKPCQNQKGTDCYIFAVEMVLVGYKQAPSKRKLFFAEKNPVFRHNLVFSHNVGTKATRSGAGGQVPINTTQKHPCFAEQLARDLCPMGGNALVVGAGSGSDVIGIARSGSSVVALEKDPVQFSACCARLLAEAQSAKAAARHTLQNAQLSRLRDVASSFASW